MDSTNQNEPSSVGEILRKIEEKADTGEYIYRGEPEHYQEAPYDGKVSSNLYREFLITDDFDVEAEQFDIEVVQAEMLEEAKKYLRRTGNDCELLVEMQHYGGKTNLIDFTTNYFVALFFACEKSASENGRIIFQRRELISSSIKEPPKPINRVVAQSSVFVRPSKGFIYAEADDVINIPADIKLPMLGHLCEAHDISTETIYNDIHGFIRHQKDHWKAYVAFYMS